MPALLTTVVSTDRPEPKEAVQAGASCKSMCYNEFVHERLNASNNYLLLLLPLALAEIEREREIPEARAVYA